MKIQSITITGYKSVQKETTLYIRDDLTCLIGANEHGKTNLLNALNQIATQNLSADDANRVLVENDINDIPKISYSLKPEEKDIEEIQKALEEIKADNNPLQDDLQPQDINKDSTPPEYRGEEPVKDKAQQEENNIVTNLIQDISNDITEGSLAISLHIDTIGRKYSYKNVDDLSLISNKLVQTLETLLPKAYLFTPSNQIPDTISPEELESKDFIEFQGLIMLAKVWNKRAELFKDGPRSVKMLTEASRELTSQVKKLWSQGKSDYNFLLTLNSGPRLALTIEDRTGNFDSPSSRSLGFRAFFSFYLALYAYTSTVNPSGYIFLFDEPDIHLHPEAQKDLLRELRNLSKSNQIIFATHSPYMIDKNNLLSTVVIKKQTVAEKSQGTKIVHKPYLSNWSAVRENLGIMMGDTLFYSRRSLFVEGTSDRLLISIILEKYKEELGIDLNYLSLLDGDDRTEALGVARILLSEGRSLVILVDGDEGGEALSKEFNELGQELNKEKEVQLMNLKNITNSKKPISIEDLLPIEIYVDALQKYIKEIHKKDTMPDLKSKLKDAEKLETRGRAAQKILAEYLRVKEDKIAKTTIADFVGQIIIDNQDIKFPESAKKLAKELKSSLDLE